MIPYGTTEAFALPVAWPTMRGMKKRLTAGTLWFVAILAMYELAWSLLGIPRPVGPIIAFVVSALVVADPAHLFWPAPTQTRNQMPPARVFAGRISASE
jgi:hypothetical protein